MIFGPCYDIVLKPTEGFFLFFFFPLLLLLEILSLLSLFAFRAVNQGYLARTKAERSLTYYQLTLHHFG